MSLAERSSPSLNPKGLARAPSTLWLRARALASVSATLMGSSSAPSPLLVAVVASVVSSIFSAVREERRRVARRRWEVPRSASVDGAVSEAPRRVRRGFSWVLVSADSGSSGVGSRETTFGTSVLTSCGVLVALRRRPIGGRGRSEASTSEVTIEPPDPAAVIATGAPIVSTGAGAPAGRDAARRRRGAGIPLVEFPPEFSVVLSVSSSTVLSLAFRHGQCPPGSRPCRSSPTDVYTRLALY